MHKKNNKINYRLSYEDQQEYVLGSMDDSSSEEEPFNFDGYDSDEDPEYVLPFTRPRNLVEDPGMSGPSGKQDVPRSNAEEYLPNDDDSDAEIEDVPMETAETDSESDDDEEEAVPIVLQGGSFKAKDGTIWNNDPPPRSAQIRAHNVLRQKPKGFHCS